MPIVGWDDTPTDAITRFDFHTSSLWLRALSRVPYFERYAYPLAVKKGLGTIWFPLDSEFEVENYLNLGWNVKQGVPTDHELFLFGAKALLTDNAKPFRKPRLAFTRQGRELSWSKAIHTANGTRNLLQRGTSPFDDKQN